MIDISITTMIILPQEELSGHMGLKVYWQIDNPIFDTICVH